MTNLNQFFIFAAKNFYLISLVLFFGYYFFMPRPKRREFFIFAIIVLPLIYLVGKIAGFIYFDPRPFVQYHFQPLISHSPDNGFPSDHELLTAGLAAVVSSSNIIFGVILWLLAILIGVARIYVGVHSPLDIAASVVVAVSVTVIIYNYLYRKGPRKRA